MNNLRNKQIIGLVSGGVARPRRFERPTPAFGGQLKSIDI